MDIHLRINELRAKENLSKKDFSAKIGIDNSQYGKIEAGKLTPTIQQIMDISSIFAVSTDWLIKGKGEMIIQTVSESNKNNSDIQCFIEKIAQQAEEIGRLRERIDQLEFQKENVVHNVISNVG